jgi:hypothetical protein
MPTKKRKPTRGQVIEMAVQFMLEEITLCGHPGRDFIGSCNSRNDDRKCRRRWLLTQLKGFA